MAPGLTRRSFLETLTALGASQALAARAAAAPPAQAAAAEPAAPVAISSGNGWHPEPGDGRPRRGSAVATVVSRLAQPDVAARPYGLLEAAVAGVGVVEDDPLDHSVGLGGLPNEDGVVQLDASVMFGPTHQAGAVAALENVQNAAAVAMHVLRYTDHVLLVGDGAYRFARAMGFEHRELLTPQAHKLWRYWKQTASERDDWLTPPDGDVDPAVLEHFRGHGGTIHLSALDAKGDLAAVTTTSGLAFKIPGRVGDSPIVGAGMFCDNEVGAAGGTGRGEEAIVNCAALSVVEAMRAGLGPREACLDVLKRVVDRARRRDVHGELFRDGVPAFGLTLYALRKDGAHGAASIHEGAGYAVADARRPGGRHEPCGWLFDRRTEGAR